MNPVLNGFLLATAEEDFWCWHGNTRLIFSDFCEEIGRQDVADLLRSMTVECAYEWDLHGRQPRSYTLAAANDPKVNHAPILLRIEGVNLSRRFLVYEQLFNPLFSIFSQGLELLQVQHLRLTAASESIFDLHYSVTSTEGIWQGVLSTERAQLQCRRRVLAMFPDATAEYGAPCECRTVGSFGVGCSYCENTGERRVKIPAPQLIPPGAEPSPRWVPYDTPPGSAETVRFTVREEYTLPLIFEPRRMVRFDL